MGEPGSTLDTDDGTIDFFDDDLKSNGELTDDRFRIKSAPEPKYFSDARGNRLELGPPISRDIALLQPPKKKQKTTTTVCVTY